MARWGLISTACVATMFVIACSSYDGQDAPKEPQDAGVVDAVAATDATEAGAIVDAGEQADAAPARAFRYVFVSSQTHDPKFDPTDGLAGADSFCANLTLNTPIQGLKWHAFLGSNSTDARDRISDGVTIAREYRLVTGATVFPAGYKFISGPITIVHSIDHTEKGAIVTGEVWTGTTDDGTRFSDNGTCNGWTYNGGGIVFGAVGSIMAGDDPPAKTWINANNRECAANNVRRVYCFEVD